MSIFGFCLSSIKLYGNVVIYIQAENRMATKSLHLNTSGFARLGYMEVVCLIVGPTLTSCATFLNLFPPTPFISENISLDHDINFH